MALFGSRSWHYRWHRCCERSGMRFTSLAALVVLLGCANSHGRDTDAGSDDPDSGHGRTCLMPSRVFCVESCVTDIYMTPECRDGVWECPDRTFDVALCPPGCGGPPPAGDCECGPSGWECVEPGCPDGIDPWDPSDPANVCSPEGRHCENVGGECGGAMFCECTSGRWECAVAEPDPACFCGREPTEGGPCVSEGEVCGACCPTDGWEPMVCEGGRWAPAVCPDVDCEPVAGSCSVNPRDEIGERCDIEGQECGDECCGDSTVCRDGRWTLGRELLCFACFSFECGEGACHDPQYCLTGPGPDDGGVSVCSSLPPGCHDCSCIPLRGGYVCEMVDGHPHVSGGWRGI